MEENKKDNDSNNESNIVKHSESYRHHEISSPYINDGIVDVPMHNVDLVNFSTSQQEKDDDVQREVYDIGVISSAKHVKNDIVDTVNSLKFSKFKNSSYFHNVEKAVALGVKTDPVLTLVHQGKLVPDVYDVEPSVHNLWMSNSVQNEKGVSRKTLSELNMLFENGWGLPVNSAWTIDIPPSSCGKFFGSALTDFRFFAHTTRRVFFKYFVAMTVFLGFFVGLTYADKSLTVPSNGGVHLVGSFLYADIVLTLFTSLLFALALTASGAGKNRKKIDAYMKQQISWNCHDKPVEMKLHKNLRTTHNRWHKNLRTLEEIKPEILNNAVILQTEFDDFTVQDTDALSMDMDRLMDICKEGLKTEITSTGSMDNLYRETKKHVDDLWNLNKKLHDTVNKHHTVAEENRVQEKQKFVDMETAAKEYGLMQYLENSEIFHNVDVKEFDSVQNNFAELEDPRTDHTRSEKNNIHYNSQHEF